jgi:hypothetical protein
LAASIAVVKLARSGSVPGRVSTAVTIAMRSSWYTAAVGPGHRHTGLDDPDR